VAGEFYNSAGVTLSNDEGPFIMDVEISGDAPAPEPSTVGLGALALLGLAATRLRRRSS
jgi:MYXO-CTERM domain-containing protein